MVPRTTTHVGIELDVDQRIVVVADSHSKPHPDAYAWIEREQPAAILHAGDIGAHRVLDELETYATVHAVRGNIDGRVKRTPDNIVADLSFIDDEAPSKPRGLRVLLTHIAVYGPRLRKDVATLAHEHEAGLVICGHSHVPLITVDRELMVFNPGSFGPRRFQLPITFGVLELKGQSLSLRHVNCETGEPWLPPAA